MDYIFDNERPIYVQLVDLIRTMIISGKLKKGEKIPSVRELALIMKVNPNTMQKALIELENEGLVHTERTNGKFVTSDEELINKTRDRLAMEKVNTYLHSMRSIGITFEDSLGYLQKLGGNNSGIS